MHPTSHTSRTHILPLPLARAVFILVSGLFLSTLACSQEPTSERPAFGIYPSVGGAFGPPNWISAQGHAYLSFTDGKSFSIYAGYGVEWGPKADSSIITVGWGGVRPIPVASKQTGANFLI